MKKTKQRGEENIEKEAERIFLIVESKEPVICVRGHFLRFQSILLKLVFLTTIIPLEICYTNYLFLVHDINWSQLPGIFFVSLRVRRVLDF